MSKDLFFPSFRRGGFGHINRCLALAQELRQRGWQTTFALDGQHAARVEAKDTTGNLQRPPLTADLIRNLVTS